MVGNIFICLNEATYNREIPTELQGSYARVSSDEEGNLIEILPTTFKEVGEDGKRKFGSVVELTIDDAKFYIMEFNASWLLSEVSALINLGNGLEHPNNTLMTNKEAIALMQDNQSEDI
jgi:hypothetical protein|tara:strand:+ start:228 stop:584 length:357 start_codon:yes stop_codon:yes gene_type:complete